MALNPAQRAKVLKDEGGCSQCLSWGHSQRQCNRSEARQQPGKTLKCQERVGSRTCGEFHHPMLHGSNHISGSVNHALGSSHQPFDPRPDIFTREPPGSYIRAGTTGTIFKVVSAPVLAPGGKSKVTSMFVDPGSNLNFILKSFASDLELQGTPTEIQLKVVDDEF